MKRFILILFLFFITSNKVFATTYYIDPDCPVAGNGTNHTCTGSDANNPKNSIKDFTITSNNSYYIKSSTTNPISNYVSINGASNVTIGAYYGSGTIGVDPAGSRPIVDGGYAVSKSNFVIVDSPYLTIQDIEQKNGRDSFVFSDSVSSSHHFTLKNCIIGENSQWGVRVYGGGTNARSYWSIHDNKFDNGAATNPWVNADGHGTSDAIQLRYVTDSEIYNNEMYDYGHDSGVAFTIGCYRNRFHHNTVGKNTYNPPYAFDTQAVGILSNNSYNEIDHNIIYGWSDGSKLMGEYNNYHHNKFYQFPGTGTVKTGWIIQMGCYSNVTESHDNAFYNNTLYKADSLGIGISIRAEAGYCSNDVYNYYIKNNMVVETGNCYSGSPYCGGSNYEWISIRIQRWTYTTLNSSIIRDFTFENNNIYIAGRTDLLEYYGASKTIAQINDLHSLDATYTSSGNVSIANEMTDPDNQNFTLLPDASSIDGGAWHTTITSNTGSGYEFYVAVSPYFSKGQTIKSQSGNTGVIDSVDYENKKITMTESFSWTKDEGLSPFEYYGTAPDIGAEESNYKILNASPIDDATGVSVGVVLTWTNPVANPLNLVLFEKVSGTCNLESPGDDVDSGYDIESYDPPGSLDPNSEYCWRVDVAGITGDVYSFTTTTVTPPVSNLKLMDVYVGE